MSLLHSAMLAFRTDGGALTSSWRTQDATVRGGRISLVPYTFDGGERTAHPAISFETTSIAIGNVSLGGAATAALQNGTVVLTRGAVVEKLHNEIDGLHQEWAFDKVPGTGDVEVDVAISGYTYASQTTGGLHFAGDGVMVRYSHAIWRGADGTAWPITATYDGGRIRMIIPAGIVAQTSFPAVLDPTVGAEVAADSPVIAPTGITQQQSAIGFGGGQYLAVWSDNRNSNKADIWATRLSSTGTVIDTAGIQIAAGAGIESNPAVTYDGSNFVVAWEDFQTPTGTVSNVAVARVASSNGAVTPIGHVTASASSQTTPNLASAGGGSALLVWNTAGEIDGAVVSGSIGATTTIATGALVDRPSVASNPGGNYLVGYTATNFMMGQFVTAAGALSGSAITISNPASGVQSQSDSTWDATNSNYIIVWKNGANSLVYGTRISTAGTVQDTHLVGTTTVGGALVNASPAQSFRPTVACSSVCLVSWHDQRNNATTGLDLYGQLMTLAWAKSGTEILISNATGPQNFPRAETNGTDFFLTWTDNRANASTQIYGSTISAAGALGTAAAIGTGNNRESATTVAAAGTNSAVYWRDSRGGPSIYGVRYDSTGAALDTTGQPVQAGTAGAQNDPAATADLGGNALVVWSDSRNGVAKDVYGARVDLSTGTVLDASGIAISTAANNQLVPAVASNGSEALVVWQDSRNGTFDIYGALISSAGTITLNDIAITTAASNQDQPSVTWDPTSSQFIVVWQDQQTGTFQIRGARVDSSGTVLDAGGVALVSSAAAQTLPGVESTAAGTLAVWQDGSHIRGTRLTGGTALTVVDTAGLTLSSTTSNQGAPRVGAFGTGYLAVWHDDRAGNLDIYGRVVNSDGTSGSDLAISTSADDEQNPSILAISGTSVRVGYEVLRLDSSRAASRIIGGAGATLTSITVTPNPASAPTGVKVNFTATGHYSDGSTANLTTQVTWASADPTVATITSSGQATAVGAAGTMTTISATLGAVSGTATFNVSNATITSITINPTSANMVVTKTRQFYATAHYSDGSSLDITTQATWASDNTAVATVGSHGVVKALTVGNANITASKNGVTGTSAVNVSAVALATITVTPANQYIAVGDMLAFTATGKYNDGSTQDLTATAVWASSATTVATMSANTATGAGAGVTTVSATVGSIVGSTKLNVTATALVSITVTPSTPNVPQGFYTQFTATGTYADSSTKNLTSVVSWTSSNPNVATVNAMGQATAIAAVGTSTITATYGAISGNTAMNDTNATLTSIAVTPNPFTVNVAKTQQLTATGTFSDASTMNLTRQVTWSSSNTGVATVGTAGVVTGVASGSATITAARNGVNGTSAATVP